MNHNIVCPKYFGKVEKYCQHDIYEQNIQGYF